MALRARTYGLAWVTCAVGLVSVTHACRAPTQVTVRIETELPCSSLEGVSIAVASEANAAENRATTGFYAASTNQCDSPSTVGTLVFTPGSTSFAFVVVAGIDRESTACKAPDYAGCVVARRRLSFVENASLDVPVTITRDCVDVACNVETSCLRGNCKSSETQCESTTCTQAGTTTPDGGGGPDGGTPDGGVSDTGPDGSVPTDAADAAADAADGAIESGAFDGGPVMCTSSPGCGGIDPPCTCAGSVKVGTAARTMKLDCSAAGATCTCTIEGNLVKSVPNNGMCTPSKYGECCTP